MTTILVIDDDPSTLRFLVTTLELVRYQVYAALDGKQGIEMALLHLPDVILCDVVMPLLDGYQVLETIRKHPQAKTIPLIFLTARAERVDQRMAMEAGADDYITKPVTQSELIHAVEAQIKKQSGVSEKYETTLHLLRKNITYALPHEARTPLTHILGYADLLIEDADFIAPEQIRDMASSILKSGERLHRIFENYLVYAQIELLAGDLPARKSFNNFVVPKPAKLIQAQADKLAEVYDRQADLMLDLNNAAIRISTENLEKIVYELVDNAFKFSPKGSAVTVQTARREDRFVVSVKDLGRGLSREQLTNVGAYMQFGRAIHEQQGLGLGLAIAKGLIALHEGTFAIQSEPGKGTVIQFSLEM